MHFISYRRKLLIFPSHSLGCGCECGCVSLFSQCGFHMEVKKDLLMNFIQFGVCRSFFYGHVCGLCRCVEKWMEHKHAINSMNRIKQCLMIFNFSLHTKFIWRLLIKHEKELCKVHTHRITFLIPHHIYVWTTLIIKWHEIKSLIISIKNILKIMSLTFHNLWLGRNNGYGSVKKQMQLLSYAFRWHECKFTKFWEYFDRWKVFWNSTLENVMTFEYRWRSNAFIWLIIDKRIIVNIPPLAMLALNLKWFRIFSRYTKPMYQYIYHACVE